MDTIYKDTLERLEVAGDYEGIMDTILTIPDEKRNYEELAPYLQKYLIHNLCDLFSFKNITEDGCILIPEWQICLAPCISQLSDRGAVLDFYLSSPAWDKELYECCAGMGSDLKQAMGMAIGSFAFAFMDGIGKMKAGADYKSIRTEFAGKTHRFKVYLSNIVGMGESAQTELDIYWELLKDDIVKRLGNQSLCLVKIYGANVGGEITGECRIDDVESPELGAKVAGLAEKWDVTQFASHKQFVFICQDEDTIQPYPYSGEEGQARFRESVLTAVRMFHESSTQELYDTFPKRLAEAIGDTTLAQECYAFLPELCAQNAFPEITYSETLDITCGNAPRISCYKAQLADYQAMWGVLYSAFGDGVFGEETNAIYQEYISVSSIYNVVRQMQEKGSNFSDCRLTALLFQMGEDFEIR